MLRHEMNINICTKSEAEQNLHRRAPS